MKLSLRCLFVLACAVLLPAEYFCVASTLETQGEVLQGLLVVLLWGNVIWVVVFWWFPRAGLVGLLSMGLLIIPYQVSLLDRLVRLNTEMMQLVDSRWRLRSEGKPIPPTLEDYAFSDPQLRQFIHRYSVPEDGRDFFLDFFVVKPGITHHYDSKTGWSYYPD